MFPHLNTQGWDEEILEITKVILISIYGVSMGLRRI